MAQKVDKTAIPDSSNPPYFASFGQILPYRFQQFRRGIPLQIRDRDVDGMFEFDRLLDAHLMIQCAVVLSMPFSDLPGNLADSRWRDIVLQREVAALLVPDAVTMVDFQIASIRMLACGHDLSIAGSTTLFSVSEFADSRWCFGIVKSRIRIHLPLRPRPPASVSESRRRSEPSAEEQPARDRQVRRKPLCEPGGRFRRALFRIRFLPLRRFLLVMP